MQRRIQPLGDSLSSFVRASKCIGSFHAAVEEVILNCIDASSRSISVYLDLQSCSFEVYDDGNGIDANCLEGSVAVWNCTSKQNSALNEFDGSETLEDSTYGMKGEALASLRHLSNLWIESCARGARNAVHTNTICIKNMEHDSPMEFYCMKPTDRSRLSARWDSTYSTGVHVYNLFHNLPVRRKAMKADTERSLIKEFIQHMSVLHHNITWTLSESSLNHTITTTTTDTVILRLPSQVSVAKRFLHMHGVDNMLNMQEISHTSRGFTLQGFLTPPISDHCTKHREGQYLYLNSRWLRGSDCMSNAVNSIYNRVITAVSGGNLGGMVARHASYNNLDSIGNNSSNSSISNMNNYNMDASANAASFSKQVNTYPYFVLHLTCPTSAYDILSEPDKSVVVFRNEVHAMHVIEEMCSTLIRQYYSDRVDALLSLVPVNPLTRATMISNTLAEPSIPDTIVVIPATTNEDHTVAHRSEPSFYSIQNGSTTVTNTAINAPYLTSPPVVQASSNYTKDTHSPYFVSSHMFAGKRNYTSHTSHNIDITTASATSAATHSPHGDLFHSAFFNNATSTTVADALSPTRTLSASNLFRDSPYATRPFSYAAKPLQAQHMSSSNILPALTYYDSPYKSATTTKAAAHLQHSGVKRMITSITEPTTHHKASLTNDSYTNTTLQTNVSNGDNIGFNNHMVSTKKVKYAIGNDSNSFDEAFRPSEGLLSHNDALIGDTTSLDEYGCPDDGMYTTSGDGTEPSNDRSYSNVDSLYSKHDSTSYGDYNVSCAENIMTDIAYADQEADLVDVDNGSDSYHNAGDVDNACGDDDRNDSYMNDVIALDDSRYTASPDGVHNIDTHNMTDAAYVASRLATPGYMQHSMRGSVDPATTTTVSNTNTTNHTSTTMPNTAAHNPTLSKHSAHTEMSLNKAVLQAHLCCIGQCDRRYIVATSCVCNNSDTSEAINYSKTSTTKALRCSSCNNASLLLLLDQHAVDERIQVEALAQAVAQARADSTDTTGYVHTANPTCYTTVTSTESLTLTTRELDTVTSRHQVLRDWGFTYTLHTLTPQQSDSSISDNISTSQPITTMLQLHTVPCIATEPLHASDLREFLHYLSAHRELPSSLLLPPVVSRIVSSRACHSAVRFGDALSHQKCVQLCQQLMNTELPFQCAHGRPSMAPLLDLRGLQEYKKQTILAAATLRVWNL